MLHLQTTTFIEFVVDVVYLPRNVHVCHAFIFSGHTGLATLLASVWVVYAKPAALALVGVASGLATAFFVSFDRNHYTVDIALAIIISVAIVLVYHLTADVGRLERGLEHEAAHELQVASASASQLTAQAPLRKRRTVLMRHSSNALALLVGLVEWVDARDLQSAEEQLENF